MIVEPTVTDLLKLVDDRYELVIVTSKRARQLAVGAPKLTDAKEKSVVTKIGRASCRERMCQYV